MRFLVILLAILISSCATKLPEPGNGVGHFIVPVFAVDESTDYGFSYQYVLRYLNTATKERGSITVTPQRGLKLVQKRNLEPGRYCFDSFFSEPIVERENRNYNYARNFKKLSGCFNIVENQITIWRTKVKVRKFDEEEGGWMQWRWFKKLEINEVDQVLAEMKQFENFELWDVEFSSLY